MKNEARKLVYVSEILDANRFRGAYRGHTYEARALPNTAGLTVGDSAFCHVLPNTELVTIQQIEQEVMYFSPGAIDDAFVPGVLYKLTAYDGVPQLVWTCPNANEVITSLAWTATTSRLYIVTLEQVGIGAPHGRIYEYNITTDTATEVWSDVAALGGQPGIDVAEFDGCLYIHCGGYAYVNTRLLRFNVLTSVTDEVIAIAVPAWPASAIYGGGVAILNNKVVWCDGCRLYESATGDPGSFAEVYDLRNDWAWYSTRHSQIGAQDLVTHKADGKIYFAIHEADDPITFDRVTLVASWDGMAVVYEYTVTWDLSFPEPHFAATGLAYTGAAPNEIYAGQIGAVEGYD